MSALTADFSTTQARLFAGNIFISFAGGLSGSKLNSKKNIERFSLLPSMFEHLVLKKKKRSTAEHVIHEKKSLFTHGRAYVKILLIAAY